MWLPPHATLLTAEQEIEFGIALTELVGSAFHHFQQAGGGFAEYHPEEPLYYCQFLARRCRGSRAGASGRPSSATCWRGPTTRDACMCHEATSPRNRALYERHGYVDQGAFTLPDGGPTLWRMWREPR